MSGLPPPLPNGPARIRVEEALRRIAAADPRLWLSRPDGDRTRAAADGARGPLAGRLLAVKDNVDVAGLATTAGCRAFAYTPAVSAPVVSLLTGAGAVVAGKTTMDQFATGLTGTRGPDGPMACVLAPAVVSGGSSSGSALAVAAGLTDIAIGTDTAGSGRVPAALNGIVGLKPTRGLVAMDGVVPACRSLDCVSFFARTCAEAALALACAVAPDGRSAAHDARIALRRLAAPRIGVPDAAVMEWHGDAESPALFAAAVDRLAATGAEIVPVDLAPFVAAGRLLYEGPWVAERLAAVGDFVRDHPGDVDPVVRDVILAAAARTAVDAYEGAYRLTELVQYAARLWAEMDLLAVPTAVTAPTVEAVARDPHGEHARLGTYTNFVNLMDLCAVSLPAGRRASGAGWGLQLVAPAFGDDLLCAVGSRFEAGAPRSRVRLAVVGAHLAGQPLNHQLIGRGARLVAATRTAAAYRLHALAGTTPAKPGLERVAEGGAHIEVEVWELEEDAFGSFVAEVPPPLGIGTVQLEDGAAVAGFICEPHGLVGAEDITRYGGWRRYLTPAG